MKNIIIFVLSISICLILSIPSQAKNVLDSDWDDVVDGTCSDQNNAWWSSAEAIRIAENVLLYQRDIGGWQKNTDMHLVLSQSQKDALITAKPFNKDCTIDNDAVMLELTYLSKVYKALPESDFKAEVKAGFLKGIQYILVAQYDNGGWPQFYPYRGGYSNHITYNDDAMTNVLTILMHIYLKDGTFSIVVEDSTVAAAKVAFDKGIECILNTQYVQDGLLTVWCAQHHFKTLEPVMARSYELASLSGYESGGVLKFLMSIDNPSYEIRRAIYYGVNWYDDTRIVGYKIEDYVNTDGEKDIRVVADTRAPDMWARFYTLEDNVPFFCSRDGIKRYSLAEISHERRNNYDWYKDEGHDVFNAYYNWYPKWGSNTEQETMILFPVPDVTYFTTDTIPVKANANEYSFGSIKKFELFVDGVLIKDFASAKIDTFLTGVSTGDHSIVVRSEDDKGYVASDSSAITVGTPSSIAVDDPAQEGIVRSFNLSQNYPNPFNPSTTINYYISAPGFVKLKIFNISGQEVKTLVAEHQNGGNYTIKWAPENLQSGLYFYQIEYGDFVESKKLIYQK